MSESPTPEISPRNQAGSRGTDLGGLLVLGMVLVVLLGVGGGVGLYLTRDTDRL